MEPAIFRPTRRQHRLLPALAALFALVAVASCAADPAAVDAPGTPSPTDTAAPTTITTTTSPATTTPATTTSTTAMPTTTTQATTNPTTTTAPPPFELIPAAAPTGTVSHGSIVVDGVERTYRLYLPQDMADGPVPLFIGLHGGTGWGDQFAQTDHIEGLAESNDFIVVHPDGVKQTAGGQGGVWNGGVCCGVAARDGVDDVAFLEALVDQLEIDHPIDPDRVYAFGHSNGAIMSYRLACESSDRIVGIGLFAGTLGIDPCTPSEPVSVIHVHGTADTNLPLAGGVGADSIAGVDFPVPRTGFDALADWQGCPAPSSSTVGDVTVDLREPCAGGAAMEFVTIESAKHAWAGGTPLRTPASGAGYADYDATAEIVAFLLAHPRS